MDTTFCVFDSRQLFYKKPFGAVAAQTPVEFRIRLPKDLAAEEINMVLVSDGEKDRPIPMTFQESTPSVNIYATTFVPPEAKLWFYYFTFVETGAVMTIKADPFNRGYFGSEHGTLWQLTVYDGEMETPKGFGKGIMYQIFPDRFCFSGEEKENVPTDRTLRKDWGNLPEYLPNAFGEVTNSDYFCGDFKGVLSKLDYIKSLGVSSIYFNPIFEAHSNHRYNTADYSKPDPLLGTEEDFQELCSKAKEMGISIILDAAFSHTGSDSIYFNKSGRYGEGCGAYLDPDSPYRNWYQFEEYPDKYASWWGFVTLPNVVETNPHFLKFVCGEEDPKTGELSDCIIKKWLGLGASGFRLDVADELPDEFLDNFYQSIKKMGKDYCIIGEVWEDASNKCAYGQRRKYLLGKQLDSVMNYPFRTAILNYVRDGNPRQFLNSVCSIVENYPTPALNCIMNSLSTHDVPRAITMLVGEYIDGHDRPWQAAHHYLSDEQYRRGQVLLKLASVLQYFMPGIPCLYYGDEAGLSGYADPFNRCCYPWGFENKELVQWFQKLGQLRNRFSFLSDSTFTPVTVTDSICSILREKDGHRVIVAVNRGDYNNYLPLPAGMNRGIIHEIVGSYSGNILNAKSAVIIEA